MRKFFQCYGESIILFFILLVGSYLRLYKISGYMTFLGDEGRDVLVVMHMIVQHKFTLLGPTASVGGFFLGPIYYYFMLPFLWLWNLDPTGPAVMVALFGAATIYFVYRLGKDLFSPIVGLVAASLYSLSPVIIAYSRSSWNPNPVPFFATLLMYFLWRFARRRSRWNLVGAGVVIGIGLQLHYLFLFLALVAVAWVLWQRLGLLELLEQGAELLGGFVIGYAPFLAFEVRHGFPNTQSIIKFVNSGSDTGASGNFFSITADVVYRDFGRLVFRLPQPEIWSKFPLYQQLLWQYGTWLTIFLALAICAGSLWQLARPHGKLPSWIPTVALTPNNQVGLQLLLLWLVGTVGLFGLYKKAIYDYYLGIIFTLPFLLFGLVFWVIWQKKILKWFILGAFAGVLFLNWQGRPFIYPPNQQLLQAKTIAAEAFSKTGGHPFNFALVADHNSDHAYRYFFEIWGNTPVTIENSQIDPGRKTVTDQLIVICEKTDCQPLGNSLWEIAGFGRAEVNGSWSVSFVKIYRLVHYRGPV